MLDRPATAVPRSPACEARRARGDCRLAQVEGAIAPPACDADCAGRGPRVLAERGVGLRGSRLARAVLRLCGWRIHFDGLPTGQGVIAVYPHTSNWDFAWGLLAKWAIGLPLAFWAKHTLFDVPLLGRFVRRVGGMPVDRRGAHGAVAQAAARLRQAREDGRFLWIALAPEGTRRPVDGWRSGFYQLALQGEVPIALAYLDYGRREIGVDSFWRPSGDIAADLACFAQRLQHRRGRRPEWAGPVRMK